jgi:hypothetical protein
MKILLWTLLNTPNIGSVQTQFKPTQNSKQKSYLKFKIENRNRKQKKKTENRQEKLTWTRPTIIAQHRSPTKPNPNYPMFALKPTFSRGFSANVH